MSVTLHTTKGDIKIELHCTHVPLPTANFLALCGNDTYTNTPIHRIIPSFIIQTGDPTGTGKTSRAAFSRRLPDSPHPALTFSTRGVVAFANSGKPSRNGIGSQFFITLAAAPHLDGTCTVIGKVLHGMEVVEAIGDVEVAEGGRPVDDIFIESVTVHANPFATGEVQFQLP